MSTDEPGGASTTASRVLEPRRTASAGGQPPGPHPRRVRRPPAHPRAAWRANRPAFGGPVFVLPPFCRPPPRGRLASQVVPDVGVGVSAPAENLRARPVGCLYGAHPFVLPVIIGSSDRLRHAHRRPVTGSPHAFALRGKKRPNTASEFPRGNDVAGWQPVTRPSRVGDTRVSVALLDCLSPAKDHRPRSATRGPRWSQGRGNGVVPSSWQMTAVLADTPSASATSISRRPPR